MHAADKSKADSVDVKALEGFSTNLGGLGDKKTHTTDGLVYRDELISPVRSFAVALSFTNLYSLVGGETGEPATL